MQLYTKVGARQGAEMQELLARLGAGGEQRVAAGRQPCWGEC